MTNHEAIQFLNNMIGEEHGRSIGAEGFYRELCAYHVDALRMAIKALEQEPCKDAISRQATLEPYKRLKDTDTLCVALIRANIMQQLSIKPQEPPKHTKCDRCPYGETKVVNICNYDGDGCGWD